MRIPILLVAEIMTADAEILAYRRNFRSRRISGTYVLRSGLYVANDGSQAYLSQGQMFPYRGTRPVTWSLSAPGLFGPR